MVRIVPKQQQPVSPITSGAPIAPDPAVMPGARPDRYIGLDSSGGSSLPKNFPRGYHSSQLEPWQRQVADLHQVGIKASQGIRLMRRGQDLVIYAYQQPTGGHELVATIPQEVLAQMKDAQELANAIRDAGFPAMRVQNPCPSTAVIKMALGLQALETSGVVTIAQIQAAMNGRCHAGHSLEALANTLILLSSEGFLVSEVGLEIVAQRISAQNGIDGTVFEIVATLGTIAVDPRRYSAAFAAKSRLVRSYFCAIDENALVNLDNAFRARLEKGRGNFNERAFQAFATWSDAQDFSLGFTQGAYEGPVIFHAKILGQAPAREPNFSFELRVRDESEGYEFLQQLLKACARPRNTLMLNYSPYSIFKEFPDGLSEHRLRDAIQIKMDNEGTSPFFTPHPGYPVLQVSFRDQTPLQWKFWVLVVLAQEFGLSQRKELIQALEKRR